VDGLSPSGTALPSTAICCDCGGEIGLVDKVSLVVRHYTVLPAWEASPFGFMALVVSPRSRPSCLSGQEASRAPSN
jgi:hypothetical protein